MQRLNLARCIAIWLAACFRVVDLPVLASRSREALHSPSRNPRDEEVEATDPRAEYLRQSQKQRTLGMKAWELAKAVSMSGADIRHICARCLTTLVFDGTAVADCHAKSPAC